MKSYTVEQFRELIRTEANRVGLRELARSVKINPGRLSSMLNGDVPPQPAVLQALGYERVFTVRRITR